MFALYNIHTDTITVEEKYSKIIPFFDVYKSDIGVFNSYAHNKIKYNNIDYISLELYEQFLITFFNNESVFMLNHDNYIRRDESLYIITNIEDSNVKFKPENEYIYLVDYFTFMQATDNYSFLFIQGMKIEDKGNVIRNKRIRHETIETILKDC